jgi:hypothetical protein
LQQLTDPTHLLEATLTTDIRPGIALIWELLVADFTHSQPYPYVTSVAGTTPALARLEWKAQRESVDYKDLRVLVSRLPIEYRKAYGSRPQTAALM